MSLLTLLTFLGTVLFSFSNIAHAQNDEFKDLVEQVYQQEQRHRVVEEATTLALKAILEGESHEKVTQSFSVLAQFLKSDRKLFQKLIHELEDYYQAQVAKDLKEVDVDSIERCLHAMGRLHTLAQEAHGKDVAQFTEVVASVLMNIIESNLRSHAGLEPWPFAGMSESRETQRESNGIVSFGSAFQENKLEAFKLGVFSRSFTALLELAMTSSTAYRKVVFKDLVKDIIHESPNRQIVELPLIKAQTQRTSGPEVGMDYVFGVENSLRSIAATMDIFMELMGNVGSQWSVDYFKNLTHGSGGPGPLGGLDQLKRLFYVTFLMKMYAQVQVATGVDMTDNMFLKVAQKCFELRLGKDAYKEDFLKAETALRPLGEVPLNTHKSGRVIGPFRGH